VAVAYDTPVAGWRANRVNHAQALDRPADRPDSCSTPSMRAIHHRRAAAEKQQGRAADQRPYRRMKLGRSRNCALSTGVFLLLSPRCRTFLRRHLANNSAMSTHADKAPYASTTPIGGFFFFPRAKLMRSDRRPPHAIFDPAWEITRKTFSYTNHTLHAQALESWPVAAVRNGCCRGHMQLAIQSTPKILRQARKERTAMGRRLKIRSCLYHDEGGERARAHGKSAFYRLPFQINGVSALPHRIDEADRVFRSALIFIRTASTTKTKRHHPPPPG